MVKETKFAQTGNNIETNFVDENAVTGGKIHWKKVGKSVGKIANKVRKNPIAQAVVSDAIGTAVGVESGNPLLGVAAAAGTQQLMGSGKSLDTAIYDEISNHIQTGGKRKMSFKKLISHPVTKKIFHEIHDIAAPIIKSAVKERLKDMVSSPSAVTGGAFKPKRINARGQAIKKLMHEKGISMIQASKLLKEMQSK
jgi:uncharacterized membrane protein